MVPKRGKYLLGHFLSLNYLTLGSLDSNQVAKLGLSSKRAMRWKIKVTQAGFKSRKQPLSLCHMYTVKLVSKLVPRDH